MCRVTLAGVAMQRMDAHPFHQREDAAATNWFTVAFEQRGQHRVLPAKSFQMQFVDPVHQSPK